VPARAQHVHDELRLEEAHPVEEVRRVAEVRRRQRARVVVRWDGPLAQRSQQRHVESGDDEAPTEAEADDVVAPVEQHLCHARVAEGEPRVTAHGHVLEQLEHARVRRPLRRQLAQVGPPRGHAIRLQQPAHVVRLAHRLVVRGLVAVPGATRVGRPLLVNGCLHRNPCVLTLTLAHERVVRRGGGRRGGGDWRGGRRGGGNWRGGGKWRGGRLSGGNWRCGGGWGHGGTDSDRLRWRGRHMRISGRSAVEHSPSIRRRHGFRCHPPLLPKQRSWVRYWDRPARLRPEKEEQKTDRYEGLPQQSGRTNHRFTRARRLVLGGTTLHTSLGQTSREERRNQQLMNLRLDRHEFETSLLRPQ